MHGSTSNFSSAENQPSVAPQVKRRFGPPSIAWTPELDERLRRLWGSNLTCEQIGAELGVTKCAATGRAHRIGLPSRIRRSLAVMWDSATVERLREYWREGKRAEQIAEIFGDRTPKSVGSKASALGLKRDKPIEIKIPKSRERKAKCKPIPLAPEPSIPFDGPAKSIIDLKLSECRYAIGVNEDGNHMFCAAPTHNDSWCPVHRQIVYTQQKAA